MGDSCFTSMGGLKRVTISEGMTVIPINAFYYCDALEVVVLPTSIREVHNSAFQYCNALKSFTLPEGVEYVHISAFSRCDNLKELYLPSTLIEISGDLENTRLKSVYYNGSLEQWYQVEREFRAPDLRCTMYFAEGSDPAAVVFDAITAAKARGCDVVICDTAGRLHNKKNLMQELAKINRIIDREAEGCAKECLLVLDATTGQNAVNQARLFQEVAPITGIVLTKLDGTAKGGIVISIKNELNIPVKLIGVGEGIDDLQPFEARSFIDALFERDMDSAENTEKSSDTVDEVSEDMIENVDEVFDDEATEEIVEIVEDTVENAVETVEEDAEIAETVADISADTVEMVGNTVESVNEAAEPESEGIPLSEWLPEEERLPVDERIPPEEGMLPLISDEKKDAEPSDADESAEQPEKKKKGFFSFFKRKK